MLSSPATNNFTIPDRKGDKAKVLAQRHEGTKIATDLIHFSSYRYTWFLLTTKLISNFFFFRK